MTVSVILHFTEQFSYQEEQFQKILQSIEEQTNLPKEIIILDEQNSYNANFKLGPIKIIVIRGEYRNRSQWLNAAIEQSSGSHILYIDGLSAEVILKRSYLEVALLAADNYPNLGMLYSDYELAKGGVVNEVKLLKHHRGRVRDNQDYGKVFFFSKKTLQEVGLFDESLEYNALYDIHLKLSEKFELVHIANKLSGSLYQVVAEGKKHNVFDYLLASKESQKEAEEVLSSHLKRIGAYFKPGSHYHPRPEIMEEYEFLASVIIPVNNRPEFIGTAIESVLHQTVQNVEVIVVVNGGFDDPTTSVAKSYMPGGSKYDRDKPPVRLVLLDINNIGLSIDLGVKAAKGKYYVQLDSDDRLKPDAVEKILEVYDSDDRIGMVIGSYEVWEKKDTGELVRVENIPVVTHDEWSEENGRNNLLRINGAGAPRSIPIRVIKEMGYFGINDEPYARNYGEDYDLVLKISERYRIGRVWEPIYEVVRHSGGTDHSINQETIDRNDEAKDWMRLKAIERRIKMNEEDC